MPITMNHTGFVVADLEKSIAFYRDGLGLRLERQVDGSSHELSVLVGYDDAHLLGAILTGTDGHALELIQYLNPPGTNRPSEQQYDRSISGATHLAFIVDDIDAVYERLLAAGGRKLNPPAPTRPGVVQCYFQDPDGNWIELIEDEVHSHSPFQIRQNTAASSAQTATGPE